jgi:hypothetical protein
VKSTCLVFRPGRQSSQVQLERWANRQLGRSHCNRLPFSMRSPSDAEAGFELVQAAIWEAHPVDPCSGITLESTGKSLRSMGWCPLFPNCGSLCPLHPKKSSLWLPVRACLILGRSGSQVCFEDLGILSIQVHAVNQTGGWVCVESLEAVHAV